MKWISVNGLLFSDGEFIEIDGDIRPCIKGLDSGHITITLHNRRVRIGMSFDDNGILYDMDITFFAGDSKIEYSVIVDEINYDTILDMLEEIIKYSIPIAWNVIEEPMSLIYKAMKR